MIEVSHVTRRFGRLTAVDDVSFRLERGEVVGFLGPNGAGKTTLLRMLTGFLPATRGSIAVAGFDVARESLAVRARVGYLAESVPLYGEHRVVEMLRFQARLHRLPRAGTAHAIGRALERVGLGTLARARIGTLSKGQRQRVGLALALLPDPEVLILDEPTSGLDPLQRLEVRALVRELAHEHTVLLSSHILPEVEALCPRVLVLARGRLVADGSREALVAQLGSPAACRLEAALGADAPEAAHALLAALPGVSAVAPRPAAEGCAAFELAAARDPRADVGDLALRRGWSVRELVWLVPTLEQLFARVALELDEPAAAAAAAAGSAGA